MVPVRVGRRAGRVAAEGEEPVPRAPSCSRRRRPNQSERGPRQPAGGRPRTDHRTNTAEVGAVVGGPTPSDGTRPSSHVVLASLDPAATAPFHTRSVIRMVAGEPAVGLGFARALVMCVAHTKVGAAVDHHSRFRQRPLTRLWVTADAAVRLVFGAGRVPVEVATQIYRTHDRIHGSVEEPAPADASRGGRYTAHDVDLLLWVWATLVDSCEVAFTRWVRPWQPGEADAYYDDMCTFARFFGIPHERIPPDRHHFAAYLERMLDDDEVGSSHTSRTVAADLVWFSRWYAPVFRPLRVAAIGTLDSRLAQRLGLHLSPSDKRFQLRLDTVLGRFYHHLPGWRRNVPYLYLAFREPTIALPSRLRPG